MPSPIVFWGQRARLGKYAIVARIENTVYHYCSLFKSLCDKANIAKYFTLSKQARKL